MHRKWGWSRREFLRSTVLALGWGAFGGEDWQEGEPPKLPRRQLGKTDLTVTLLGLGAAQVGVHADEDRAVEVVQRMIDLGVNYIDTAPSYAGGISEARVGKAIRERRDKVILATKTGHRDRKGALADLEGSLRRLGTDHIDIWQIHSIQSHGDLDRALQDQGSVKAGEDAIRSGKVRFLGVTGHAHPDLNLRAIREYDFATILMPLNVADPLFLSFEKEVLPAAVEKGMGVVAMKVLAAGNLPGRGGLGAQDCVRYAASLPISCAVVGLKSVEEAEAAATAIRLPPLGPSERAKLTERIPDHPGKSLEWYKNKKIRPRSE